MKAAICYMAAKHRFEEIAQVNKIYRFRYYSKVISSKPAQRTVMYVLNKNAVHAVEEEKKFMSFVMEIERMVKMATLSGNILRSMELAEELEKHQDDNGNVLPYLLDAYLRRYLDKVNELLDGQKRCSFSSIQGSQSLGRNNHERNCGLSEEGSQNSSGFE